MSATIPNGRHAACRHFLHLSGGSGAASGQRLFGGEPGRSAPAVKVQTLQQALEVLLLQPLGAGPSRAETLEQQAQTGCPGSASLRACRLEDECLCRAQLAEQPHLLGDVARVLQDPVGNAQRLRDQGVIVQLQWATGSG